MKVKFFLAESYFGHRNLGIAFLAPMRKVKFFLAESLLGIKIWAETFVFLAGLIQIHLNIIMQVTSS